MRPDICDSEYPNTPRNKNPKINNPALRYINCLLTDNAKNKEKIW